MMRILFFGVTCFVILALTGNVSAQELSIEKGENIQEWHAIAAALISNGRYEESIKYYDMILEINPNNVKALASKGIALSHLQKYDEALFILDEALALEPDNKLIKAKKANFLSGAASVSAHNSVYDINLRITIRDSSGNLVSISESTNTRYLPYDITEKVFAESFDKRDIIVNNGKKYEIVEKTNIFEPSDNAMGLFSIYRVSEGYNINIFEAFTPMILLEKDDTIQAEWTILKKII